MPNCFDVSSYFLTRSAQEKKPITNLKLQKLMYYAQGFYVALHDNTLFDNTIQAWDHGPVVCEVYRRYKHHKDLPIPLHQNFNAEKVFNVDQIAFLDSIYESFGTFGAWTLREMTHKETPWLNHSKDGKTADSGEISTEEMKDHFKKFIAQKDYLDAYIKLSKVNPEESIIALPTSIDSADKFIHWIRNQNN